MLFHSLDFVVFFAAVAAAHWLLPARFRRALLLAAGWAFCASFGPRHLVPLAALTLLSYFAAPKVALERHGSPRTLWIAAVLHVAAVFAFKLPGDHFGFQAIGLSYYAFQSLGYLIDVHRGGPVTESLSEHALFLAFFPQLLSGPIDRARHLLPQLRARPAFDSERFLRGLHLVFWGAFQKVVVGDNLAYVVRGVFDGTASPTAAEVLLAVYAFAFQLYADFAGYTDMARGLAGCLGVELPRNFDRPFLAEDMRDFWKRWHMSLTSWFTDYLYKPLLELPVAGKLYLAPWFTLFLMGLWHGLTPTMAFMGFYYGAVIAATLWWQGRGLDLKLPRAVRVFLTFQLVCLGFLFLRARSLDQAFYFLRQLGDLSRPASLRDGLITMALFGWAVILAHLPERKSQEHEGLLFLRPHWRAACYVALFYMFVVFGNDEAREFIYLQF